MGFKENGETTFFQGLSKEDRKLLSDYNNTHVDYHSWKMMYQLFEEQVRKTPDNIALVYRRKTMTYNELNQQSNALARSLEAHNVKPGDTVGIICDRSFEMIVGMLAILKSGGAYVPIDPSYPEYRIKYIIENSGLSVVVVGQDNEIDFQNVIRIDKKELSKYNTENLALEGDSKRLAYIIYTSGSTGLPKGVMIEHHSAVNLITSINNKFFVTEKDTLLFITSMCFDLSVYDIFGILAVGGKVVIAEKEQVQDPKELKKLLKEEKITFWDSVPSTMNHLVNELELSGESCEYPHLRLAFMSGDWIPVSLPARITSYFPNTKIVSLGGATEGTVWSIYYVINPSQNYSHSIPYGKPLDNNQFYILDNDRKPVSVGQAGELYIGGIGVARGYINDDAKTRDSFIEDIILGVKGDKLYKTGDKGRMMPDGNIEFLGRIDYQVKIRGYRIELGEIENQILQNQIIKEAVVIDKTDNQGLKYLNLYYTAKQQISGGEIKEYLLKKLPEYMIPSCFIQLETMPLTLNGKIDRKALAEIEVGINNTQEDLALSSETEIKLADIWMELLDKQRIGAASNFFELGGHSLKATVLVHFIQREFQCDISIRHIFEAPTLREMAQLIENADNYRQLSITPIEESDYYIASSAQKRLYSIWTRQQSETNYNVPFLMITEGKINKEKLEYAFQQMVNRHEALRTSFHMTDGELFQRVHQNIKFSLEYFEIQDPFDEALKAEEFVKPFDLNTAPLIRGRLIYSGSRYLLLLDSHHIITDGTSMDILFKEIMKLYANEELEPITVQYKDYAAWQNRVWMQDNIVKQKEYWMENLKSELPVLNLPYDYERPLCQSYEGNHVVTYISEAITSKLNQLARKTDSTLYVVLLSAYKALLYKYTNNEDIIVGTVFAGRNQPDLQKVVGMFVNTVPIRSYPIGDKSFTAYLKEVKEVFLNAYENQSYQFDDIIKDLNIRRDMGRNPVFDTMFDFQNTGITALEVDNAKFINSDNIPDIAKFDITIGVQETDGCLKLKLEYCTKLFKRETIERMAEHLKNLLHSVAVNSDISLKSINILTSEEMNKILYEFNNTAECFDKNKTIKELFEMQAERTPDKAAVVYCGVTMTYSELNQKSNQLAKYLSSKFNKENPIIAIMAEPSIEMIIGILGIIKSGAAYLPIDPQYPHERIKFILEDSRAEILLTHKRLVKGLEYKGELYYLESNDWHSLSDDNMPANCKQNDLAYVIYTSGSTGKPKGVMVEHKALVNLCYWHNKNFNVTDRDNSTKYAGFGFDASVWEIFPYVIKGATLHILKDELKLDMERLNEYFEENNITLSFLPTQLCEQFIKLKNKSLRYLLTGGDKLKEFRVNGNYKLINNYGPTENTVVTTSYEVNELSANIPIGKPIANTQVYILDKDNNVVPIGVQGEICISGDSLAKGYLNRESLTEAKFVTNPVIAGQKMYRTGDLGKWTLDGAILFLGRIDKQVKIRGYRIELGEIETHISQIDGIKEAVVIDKEDKEGNKYLLAFYTARMDIPKEEIRDILGNSLPAYMIPLDFICLPKILINANGKVDRLALSQYESEFYDNADYVEPRDEQERILVNVWQEVLGVDKVGIEDDFFCIGGDSIKAIQIISRLQKYGLKLEVKDLLQKTKIRKLKGCIKVKEKENLSQDTITGEVNITPIQKWFFEQKFAEPQHFNQSVTLFCKERLEENILHDLFKKLLEHHDALRMCYTVEGNQVKQYFRDLNEGELYSLKVCNIVGAEDDNKAMEIESKHIQSGMDLGQGPLVRLILFKASVGDYLFIAIHHLVIDGVSWRILFEDISRGYLQGLSKQKISFDNKTNSYKAWAKKLKEYAKTKEVLAQREYWEEIVKNQKPLTSDFAVKDRKAGNISNISTELSETETQQLLKNSNRAFHTEINDLLLVALGLAIKEWQGINSIVINMEGHGREGAVKNIDITRTVGWFTSQYPIRLDLSNIEDLSYVIKAVKESLRHIPFKGFGYQLLRYMQGEESSNLDYDAEISFNYLGQFGQDRGQDVFKIQQFMHADSMSIKNQNISKLSINCLVIDGCLKIQLGYDKNEFLQDNINNFACILINKLKEVIKHCVRQRNEEITPYDVGRVKLSLRDFDIICKEYNMDNIKKIYCLTPLQAGMLIHCLKNEKTRDYFEQISINILGKIQKSLLEKSFGLLVQKYDVLRTGIFYDKLDTGVQVILKERNAEIYYYDKKDKALEEQNKFIEDFMEKDKERGFDFTKDTLLRLGIIRVSESLYKAVFSFHHIILDGWSFEIILKEWKNIYNHLAQNSMFSSEENMDFGDYIGWLEQQDKEQAEGYWMDYLQDYENYVGIPSRSEKSNSEVQACEDFVIIVDESQTKQLKDLSNQYGLTLNSVFQGIWSILLRSYNNTDDVVFGTVVSGRQADIDGIEEMVGLFINTIPMRIKAGGNTTFLNYVIQLQKISIESTKYAYYSLDEIQGALKLQRGLFNHIIAFENYPVDYYDNPQNNGIIYQKNSIEAVEQTNYDLNVIVQTGDSLKIKLKYNPSLYDKKLLSRLEGHIRNIIKVIFSNIHEKLQDINILTDTEKKTLLFEFNDNETDYGKEKTIPEIFEEYAHKQPQKTAVVYKEQSLTYGELNERAEELSRHLINQGVKAGDIVAILLNSCVEMIVNILGILKSGAAYLPIDSKMPLSRVHYMLEDCDVNILVTAKEVINTETLGVELLYIKDLNKPENSIRSIKNNYSAKNCAYIMYTSGTTGEAKGIRTNHSNIIRVVKNTNYIELCEKDSVLQTSNYSFDGSTFNIFGALLNGAKLVLIENVLELSDLSTTIRKEEISVLFLTTLLFNMLVDADLQIFKDVRKIVFGGEAASVEHVRKALAQLGKGKLINVYGPTETTVFATAYPIDAIASNMLSIPIGFPISNTQIYILDSNLKVQPIGVSGELYIGGAGVAMGYLNKEELTKERFIENPFVIGDIIYRSGDIGRWLENGVIEYLGRADDQVKIRGFRIELQEIETLLSRYEGINEAIVVVNEDKADNKFLVAYVTGKQGITLSEIRGYLLQQLPAYKVPSRIVILDRIPITANGKLDKSALPMLEADTELDYVAPRNQIEEKLVSIYKKVLGVSQFGINNNYFEHGGNSLKTTLLVNRIFKEINIKLKIEDFFQKQTIQEISELIHAALERKRKKELLMKKLIDLGI